MDKILEIVNQLQSTSSRNEKESILKKYKDNQLWKDVLYFVFNPYIVTGLSSKKINKIITDIWMINSNKLNTITKIMEYLETNNTGKDENIFFVQNFIRGHAPGVMDLLTKIVTKDLSLGIDAKTINKVYGNIIPIFNVMLAHKYADHENKVTGEFILTTKLDGIRCVLIKEDGSIKLFSRQGQPLEGLVEIESEALNLHDGVYDGELILKNDNNLNSDDLYRATVKVVRKDGEKHNVEYNVFDYLPVEDFQNGKSDISCAIRKVNIHEAIGDNFNFIKEVKPLYVGDDKEVIFPLLNTVISKGQEGLMLNVADAPYECKRSNKILKIKKMNTVDLKVTGYEEGTGKYKGMLGRINVDYKGFTCGVGSGFTDEDRVYVWQNQDNLLGTIVEVQYFEESKNQKSGISLRFPIFKRFRTDKKEVSYN